MEGQPLLSIADVQWVLHHISPKGGSVRAEVERDGDMTELNLRLDPDWRRADDISWRAASWQMRRIASGGLRLESASPEQRDSLEITDAMALVVTHVGQYDAHAAAKRAGFKKGDVIVGFDGRDDLMRESDLFAHVSAHRAPGDMVSVDVIREGLRLQFELPIQK